jgi:hypothetical protein
MSARPNFSDARLAGGVVRVNGSSDPDPADDIVAIRVVLSQGAQVTTGDVRGFGENWNVDLPDDGFSAGPATAFGVESRKENATVTTWAQGVQISK